MVKSWCGAWASISLRHWRERAVGEWVEVERFVEKVVGKKRRIGSETGEEPRREVDLALFKWRPDEQHDAEVVAAGGSEKAPYRREETGSVGP